MQPTPTVRFESFSDGVFAIAVTLLALELRVPILQGTYHQSFRGLIPLIPSILTFVLSFISIAIFWVNHHQLTQKITTITKRRVLWLNVLFLLFITVIPFVTETVSVNSHSPLAVNMYAFIMFSASVSFSLLRYWIRKGVGQDHVAMKRSLIGPAFYFLAILAPGLSLALAYSLLLIPPLFYFLPKESIS